MPWAAKTRGHAVKHLFYSALNIVVIALLNGFAHSLAADDDFFEIKEQYRAYDQGTPSPEKAKLLGLEIVELVEKKELSKAQTLLKSKLGDADAPHEIINWWLARIAIENKNWSLFRKYIQSSNLWAWQSLVLIQEIYNRLPNLQKKWLVTILVKHNFLAKKPDSSCPFFELTPRKERASFLFKLAKEHQLPDKIQQIILAELYIQSPEAIEVEKLQELPSFKKYVAKKTVNDIENRMNNLLVFGKNKEARQTLQDYVKRQKQPFKVPCELDYIGAKIYRKMRKYAEARKRFGDIAQKCPPDIKIKARYMDLFLAATNTDEASLSQFDAFVDDYPTHSFSDDVLLFKASILKNLGRIDEAQSVLSRLIELYPDGDMIERALFLKAFNAAHQGRHALALETLKSLEQKCKPNSISCAQAQYWQARLTIFTDLMSLSPARSNKDAKKSLLSLANASHPTVYSWFSLELLSLMGEKVQDNRPDEEKTIKEPKLVYSKDKRMALIRRAAMNGFRDEALALLGEITLTAETSENAKEMAMYYDMLNRPEQGHQQLVRCNSQVAQSLKSFSPKIFERLSYPLAYLPQVAKAEGQYGIPQEIILAIMRQESGFMSDSCSWAGAKGLMQLMYSSALGQAKSCGVDNLKEEDLYEPGLNINLAASLLKKYWQQFGNFGVTLAAYNAGPTMARSWLNKNAHAPLDTFIENISFSETRDYVKAVLEAGLAYRRLQSEKKELRLEMTSQKTVIP